MNDTAVRHSLSTAGDLWVARQAVPSDGRHAIESAYVETFWLPTVGPSALWMLRRLNAVLRATPDGYTLPLDGLAAALGLGTGTNTNSPVVRTLARLVTFRLVGLTGRTLFVPEYLAPVSSRQLSRLPQFLAAGHPAAA